MYLCAKAPNEIISNAIKVFIISPLSLNERKILMAMDSVKRC